ncbi:hypothetical protein HY041_04495, partial [Candidatus Roizmanbacteria bacterium]|nr:hypothetical protein [Candidatus Roizmanbacteria bacterium]
MAFSKIIFLSITIVFIFVFVTCSGAEEEKGGGEKATEKYFKNISRLQYRKSINGGENAITQGTFLILPYGFTFAELLELSTGINEKNATNFSNFDLEMKLSRYMIPSEDWGRTFSWVARFQSAS